MQRTLFTLSVLIVLSTCTFAIAEDTKGQSSAAAETSASRTSFEGSDLQRSLQRDRPVGDAPVRGVRAEARTRGDDRSAAAVVAPRSDDRADDGPASTTVGDELTLSQNPQLQSKRDVVSRPLGNPTGESFGNTVAPNSGNTMGSGGLTIVGTPGSVMTGGSGNIFLPGPGPGNFINGGDGNQIIAPPHMSHVMGITDAHVMQGGDGNYIIRGAGITIQSGVGNTSAGTSGNTVTSGPGNSAGGSGNTVGAGPGNTNGR